MKQAVSSVLKTRSTLIATHLCVCSISVGVTLAILNVHPVIGLVCFMTALFCIASISKKINKEYWSRNNIIIYSTGKDRKIHVERSKMMEMEEEESPKEQDQLKW